MYGDATVWVSKNGEVIQERIKPGAATGAAGFGHSPKAFFDHTIFELRFPAKLGGFTVWLSDPGPTSNCLDMVDEPNVFSGTARAEMWPNGAQTEGSIRAKCEKKPCTPYKGKCPRHGEEGGGGQTCDQVIARSPRRTTCDALTNQGYDCEGCACETAAPTTPTPSPSQSPTPTCAQPRRHELDGKFDESWRCLTPVQGRYTMAFFDFVKDPESETGFFLYITNDCPSRFLQNTLL